MRNSKENGQAIASTSQTRNSKKFDFEYIKFRGCEGEVASVQDYLSIINCFGTDDGRGVTSARYLDLQCGFNPSTAPTKKSLL